MLSLFFSHLLADGEGDVPHEEVEPGEPLDRFCGILRAFLGPILRVQTGWGIVRVLRCEGRGTRYIALCIPPPGAVVVASQPGRI